MSQLDRKNLCGTYFKLNIVKKECVACKRMYAADICLLAQHPSFQKDIETNVVLNQYIQHPISFKGNCSDCTNREAYTAHSALTKLVIKMSIC
ncbi:hypothetical protein NQ315_015029 [Exocentrus adspersus]|uniref:Uncharacterized protein n=1 Tax=Exocentrus adspersus TaxID=1586481 RepID=A0AAV8VWY8_9CUCU|nr:hypothetical protein NQ315_015029 [Exocentrus adspersus]